MDCSPNWQTKGADLELWRTKKKEGQHAPRLGGAARKENLRRLQVTNLKPDTDLKKIKIHAKGERNGIRE